MKIVSERITGERTSIIWYTVKVDGKTFFRTSREGEAPVWYRGSVSPHNKIEKWIASILEDAFLFAPIGDPQ